MVRTMMMQLDCPAWLVALLAIAAVLYKVAPFAIVEVRASMARKRPALASSDTLASVPPSGSRMVRRAA